MLHPHLKQAQVQGLKEFQLTIRANTNEGLVSSDEV